MNKLLLHIFIKTILPVAVMILCNGIDGAAQQKIQFTQYMFNGLVINPAYAGVDEALNMTFVQRSQWTGVDNAPETQTLSAHTRFKKKHVGLGVTLINDKIGVHKNVSALTNYAYHLKVGPAAFFSMGLQAGINNVKSDYASLMNGPNNDPRLSDPFISYTFFDFGAGVYYRDPKLHVGLSAPELIPQRISINDSLSIRLSKVNFFFFTKYRVKINENLGLEPGFLFKYLSNVPLSFDINTNLIYREVLTVGLSYRKSESVDFLLKGQVTQQLQFGYSYDHVIGKVSNLSSGSHELMVNYVFRFVQKNVSSPR